MATTRGASVRLGDLHGAKRALLIFVPTIGGRIDEFRAPPPEVYGLVPGGALTPKAFFTSLDLPFPLLVDQDRRVAAAYKADRSAIVIGHDGTILARWDGVPSADDLLRSLR